MTEPATLPDKGGHYGIFGGQYVPEALNAALTQLDREFDLAMSDPAFVGELHRLRPEYAGRPTPITEVPRLSEHAGNARLVVKREDLNHTGSHKINNVLGQALLTRRMGKTRVIAETGAGPHPGSCATNRAVPSDHCGTNTKVRARPLRAT